MNVTRISISLEPDLLRKMEAHMGEGVFHNRSKAISDILRDALLKKETLSGKGIRVGTISIVYNHHMRGVLDRITGIQHQFGAAVIATMHVHLSHDECLEVISTRGNADKIQKMAEAISSVRGVTSCKLSIVK